ncbi:hypothetical protein OYT1_ch2592 [Ferriphaselus amnicola]|uniref:Uncharacterized protein n=1 Tax=Ferriphaselus amnicola TaxID=1188319 RepID=A0A2Z6GFS4_9PROT|nr:hypothetical protein [Ferriphaselus amnicola]BBE52104.1 hypothetical protein OYT1_ch2592 [Ferriphaselus amnicola]
MQTVFEKALWIFFSLAIYILMGSMLLAALLITLPVLLAVLVFDRKAFYRTFGLYPSASEKTCCL